MFINKNLKYYNYLKSNIIRYPKSLSKGNIIISRKLMIKYNLQRKCGAKKQFCFVPFTNLYFNTEGNVWSCCFNSNIVLGNYPKQTIEEIWKSDKRKELGNALKYNDLSCGCNYCKYQLEIGKFSNLKASLNDKFATTSYKKYPSILEFELSNKCNLECIMCSGRSSSLIRKNREKLNDIPDIYDDNFIEQLKKYILHAKEMMFYGGEPFLIPIYYKIWDLIIELNPKIKTFILTNGTIFNDKVEYYIRKLNCSMGISIDALQPELYEEIRKNASFKEVMQNILEFQRIMQIKKRNLGFFITPMTLNRNEIPKLIDFANNLDSSVYFSFPERPKKLTLWSLSKEELTSILNQYQKAQISCKGKYGKANKKCFSDLILLINDYLKNNHRGKNPNSRSISVNRIDNNINFQNIDEILKNKLIEICPNDIKPELLNFIEISYTEVFSEITNEDKALLISNIDLINFNEIKINSLKNNIELNQNIKQFLIFLKENL